MTDQDPDGSAWRHRPVSAAYLQRTLSEYFKVRVRVEQFIGNAFDGVPAYDPLD